MTATIEVQHGAGIRRFKGRWLVEGAVEDRGVETVLTADPDQLWSVAETAGGRYAVHRGHRNNPERGRLSVHDDLEDALGFVPGNVAAAVRRGRPVEVVEMDW